MYSTATGLVAAARMLRSSSNCLIRSGSSTAGTRLTWPVWSRGYHEDPKYPKAVYHPYFSMGYTIDSSDAPGLNELRAKYGLRGAGNQAGLPWQRFKAINFNCYPGPHFDSCQEVLRTFASQQPEFLMEIGDPFCTTLGHSDACILVFNASSPILQGIHVELMQKLDHIIKKSVKPPKAQFNSKYRKIRPNLTAKSLVAKVPQDMADAVLKDLKEHRSKGTWKVTVDGFETGVVPRSEYYQSLEFIEKIIKFPFQKHKNYGS